MQTARHLERLWTAGRYSKLIDMIATPRRMALPDEPRKVIAAAVVLLRLQELNQPIGSFGKVMRGTLIAEQAADGSWADDVRVTALCVRALGGGDAADAGRAALTRVQHDDGGFPALAVKRLPGDVPATIEVVGHLLHLPPGELPDVDGALAWLDRECPRKDRRQLALLHARRTLRTAAA